MEYDGLELNEEQTNLVCQGLMDLAAVDGVDPSETELIENFYSAAGGDKAKLDELLKQPFDIEKAKKVFDTPDARNAFLLSCYMLIYADGVHSEPERKRISEFAAALDVSAAELEDLHVKARMYLLRELAQGLRNRDVVRQVGMSMGLDDNQMSSL